MQKDWILQYLTATTRKGLKEEGSGRQESYPLHIFTLGRLGRWTAVFDRTRENKQNAGGSHEPPATPHTRGSGGALPLRTKTGRSGERSPPAKTFRKNDKSLQKDPR